MVYGTPLISFAIKYGPRDILQDRQAGILVPYGDEEALAAALVQVISDKALQKRCRPPPSAMHAVITPAR